MLLLILKCLNEKYRLVFYLFHKCLLFTHYMQILKRFLSKSSPHYLTKVKVRTKFLPSTLYSLILFPGDFFPPVLYLLPKKTFNFLLSPHFGLCNQSLLLFPFSSQDASPLGKASISSDPLLSGFVSWPEHR